MRQNLILALLFVTGLTGVFSCSAPVEAVYSKPFGDADYAAYQTFNFLDVSFRNDSSINLATQEIEMLKKAITHEMQALGYELAADPDLWVNIGVQVEQKVQTRTTDIRDAPIYIGQRRYHWESEERIVRRYEQGTVTLDLIDASRHERIWEGVAIGTLTKNKRKMQKRVDEAMEQLFNRFPLKQQSSN